MQYPVEVPGVPLETLVAASMRARDVDAAGLHDAVLAEAAALGVRAELLTRGVNDEFSGGEQKRAETVQLAVLQPKFAILDEIDSGLDVDSLRDVVPAGRADDAGVEPRRARDHALRAGARPSSGPTGCT